MNDSGKRVRYKSGMVREPADDKINWALALDGPMFQRLAVHLSKGAKKYGKRNWMLATDAEELERARESAFRHFMQWWLGWDNEDHAAAVMFNINEVEYINGRAVQPATKGRSNRGRRLLQRRSRSRRKRSS